MEEFKALSQEMRTAVRQFASATLVDSGFTEVGSSDINHQIVGLYHTHGSFDEMMIAYTEYLFG